VDKIPVIGEFILYCIVASPPRPEEIGFSFLS